MLATVVIPIKNVAPWISEAISSIDAPSWVELEILCVDDVSTDNSLEIIRELNDPRVRIVPNAGSGIADGTNTGGREARGEEIYYLDGDDRYVPGAIAALHEGLAANPEAAAVAGYSSFMDEAGREIMNSPPLLPEGPVNDSVSKGLFIHPSAFVFRKKDLMEVGWARNYFRMGHDRDFLFRLAEQRQVYYLPIHVTELRVRRSSASRTTKASVKKWYRERAREFRDQRMATGADDLMRGTAPEISDDLPEVKSESPDAFANRMIIAAAWTDLSRGDLAGARKHLVRSLANLKYFPYSLGPKLKLFVLILRAQLKVFRKLK